MISENLELLKKLDPELWKMIQSSYPIPEKRDWEHPGKEEIDKWQIDVKYAIEDSIQGCLQRAIEANGWAFEVRRFGGRPSALIEVLIPDQGYNQYHSEADSPAAALLAAYCEAIR